MSRNVSWYSVFKVECFDSVWCALYFWIKIFFCYTLNIHIDFTYTHLPVCILKCGCNSTPLLNHFGLNSLNAVSPNTNTVCYSESSRSSRPPYTGIKDKFSPGPHHNIPLSALPIWTFISDNTHVWASESRHIHALKCATGPKRGFGCGKQANYESH